MDERNEIKLMDCNLDPCPYCGPHKPHSTMIQNIKVNTPMSREPIYEIGRSKLYATPGSEEWNRMMELEDSCGGVFACGGLYDHPTYLQPFDWLKPSEYPDATQGATDEIEPILFNITCRYAEPLEDASLRDGELKTAIMRHFKSLLLEAAQQLEGEGY